MSFNFNDWYNQINQSNDPNMNYGGPANNYDYYGLTGQGQGQQPQGPGASIQPVGYPDIYGNNINSGNNINGGGGFGGGDVTGPGGFNNPTGGTYTDEFGNQQPNTPISHIGSTTGPYGAATMFNGQQVDYGQGGMVMDPMTGKMVSANQGPSATSGPDLFNNPGLPKLDANSKIPNATDNYGPGMTDAMNKSAAANAQSQLAPNLPGGPGAGQGAGAGAAGPLYNNLYGSGVTGAQQGFNELNNKQFTDTGADFKSVFGSTQGQGMGNNFNWNVYPQFSADQLDPAAQQQIVAIAQANPQYDFEPTMVNGKWVLASRARDISQQKSLLAPQLPPTNGGGGAGGSGGGARTSSGGGYTKYPTASYGSSGAGAKTTPGMTQAQALANIGKGAGLVKGLAGSVATAMDKQGLGAGQQAPYTPNVPYVPVSGTGAGYYPTPDQSQVALQKLKAAMSGAGSALGGAANNTPWWASIPSAPPTTSTPPEGAIRVNPDDSRSVWHNGAWQLIPGINS